jgi:BioD-like phosphotransacetylase family protein
MSALYITSLSEYAGKTMLCAGLGKNWQGGGRKVGFFKPRISGTGTQYESDKDAAFMKLVLALQEPVDMLSPIIDSQGDMAGSVKRAYGEIAQGKDIVLVDGLPLNASGPVVEALDAKVLVIHDYSVPLSAALPEYKKLAARLSGVVLNKVPRRKIVEIKTEAASDLPGAGVNFLGVVPEDRVFTALTVAELAELLQGKILNDTEKSEELVENVMLGAMTFDSAIDY